MSKGENTVNELEKEKNEKNSEKKEIVKLKSEVDKLSQDLKSAVSELKRSIVDIRSAVSEIENPFNLLRVISSEEDLKKFSSEKLPQGVKSLVLEKPEKEEKVEKEVETEEIEEITPVTPPTHEEKELESEPPREETFIPKPKHVRVGTAYLDWVWALLDLGFTSDDVRQLAGAYEVLGFLPKGSSGKVHALAVAAEKAKSKGLTKGKLLLNMYKASVASGIEIGMEDVKALISIAEGKTRKSRRGA